MISHLKFKRISQVEKEFKSEDDVEFRMKEITSQLNFLRGELEAAYYVKHVLNKGFGVGDVITNGKIRAKIEQYTNGVFMAREIRSDKRRTSLFIVYNDFKIV